MKIKRLYTSMLCGGLLIPSLKAHGQEEQPNIIVIISTSQINLCIESLLLLSVYEQHITNISKK